MVVETTNFNGKTAMTNLGVPGSPALTPSTPSLRFTERFTRAAQDTIEYQMTVEDPEILTTGKWSAAFPMKLDNDYQMFDTPATKATPPSAITSRPRASSARKRSRAGSFLA